MHPLASHAVYDRRTANADRDCAAVLFRVGLSIQPSVKGYLMLGLGCIRGPASTGYCPRMSVNAKGCWALTEEGAKILARRQEQGQGERVLQRTLSRVGSFRGLRKMSASTLHKELFDGDKLKGAVEGLLTIKARGDKSFREKAAALLECKIGGKPLRKWKDGSLAKAMSRRANALELSTAARKFDEVGEKVLELHKAFAGHYRVMPLNAYLSLSELKPEVASAVDSMVRTPLNDAGGTVSTLDAKAINELHDAVLKGGEGLVSLLEGSIKSRSDVALLKTLVNSLERGADSEQSPIVSALDNLVSRHPNLSVVLGGLIRYTQQLESEWLKWTHDEVAARLDKTARAVFFVDAFKGEMSILEPCECEAMQRQLQGSFGHQLEFILYHNKELSRGVSVAFESLRMVFDLGVFGPLATRVEAPESALFYEAAKIRVKKPGVYALAPLG